MHKKTSVIEQGEVSTHRLEFLVDGVFAIAMTLLVLDIRLPELSGKLSAADLFWALLGIGPKLLSYLISFVILGMFWVAHHTQYRFIKRLDNAQIWLNLFYLLFIAFFPFTGGLLGAYGQNLTAVIFYGLHLMVLVVLHYFMWRHAGKAKLLAESLDAAYDRLADRLGIVALAAYALAIALAFWNVNFALVIYALTPIPYIFGWIYYL